MEFEAPYRQGSLADAQAMVELVNIAGQGLPLYLWGTLAEAGQSPWEVGHERARRESGGFSYRNAVIREEDGKVTSCLIGYPLPDRPEPVDYGEMPPMFVPLQQLEDEASGTWYVNVLATYPEYRNRGYGRELLGLAVALARETGRSGLSLIVADANRDASRLYRRQGFDQRSTRPMVKEAWQNDGENWVLMVREGLA